MGCLGCFNPILKMKMVQLGEVKMNWSRPGPQDMYLPLLVSVLAELLSVPSHEQREETGPGVLTLLCLSYLLKLSEVGVESLKGNLCLNVLFLRGFSNSRQHLSHQPRPSINSLFHKLCLSKLAWTNTSQNQHTTDCCKYLNKYKLTIAGAL